MDPVKVIDVPGIGPTEFPADMQDKDIVKAIQRTIIKQKIDADPISQGAKNFAADMPWHEKFLAGMGKAPADIGLGVRQMLNIADLKEGDDARVRDAPLMRTGAGLAGNITGGLASMVPSMMVPGANTVAGASVMGGLYGAAMPVGEGDSRGQNALIGMLGGAGGQTAANLVGRAARPVQSTLNAPMRDLANKAEQLYQIPLSAANKTGSKPLAVIESVLESLPLTADSQAAVKAAKAAAFNRATLKTVGETADLATPDVLNAARTRIGDEFTNIAARNTVQGLDKGFFDALVTVESNINHFTSPAVRQTIDKALELASQGSITGKAYQNIRSTLGKQSGDAFKSGNSELGQALKQVRNALDDAATGSISAADKDAWKVAREQWQALKVIEKAAAPNSADAVAGNISPAKLAQALLAADRQGFTYGTKGGALPDLARIGKAFVGEQVPNSGTAQRSFYQQFLTHPLDTAWQLGVGGISWPMQKMVNSRAGQAYLGQGPVDPRLLEIARRMRQGTGMAGAAAATADQQSRRNALADMMEQ